MTHNQTLSQWFTPSDLAYKMAELASASFSQGRVLEPSFGGGVLVNTAKIHGAKEIVGVEIDKYWYDKSTLKTKINADFLEVNPFECAVALMNPPLSGGVGLKHIDHALKFAPYVVSILRTVDLHGVKRHDEFWSRRDVFLNAVHYLSRRPRWHGSGKFGSKEDFVVVEITSSWTGNVTIDWW